MRRQRWAFEAADDKLYKLRSDNAVLDGGRDVFVKPVVRLEDLRE